MNDRINVFISSSEGKSRAIAAILYYYLPIFSEAIHPYSPGETTPGSRPGAERAEALSKANVGIICLTDDNLKDPWVMFDAGALSKNIRDAHVCPLLFGIAKSELEGPLLIFQAAEFDKKEMHRVVTMINSEVSEGLSQEQLDRLDTVFEKFWPDLDNKVKAALSKPGTAPVTARTQRSLVEEILERTRVAGLGLEKEFKGRLLSGLGYVIGEMSYQNFNKMDKDRLKEAVRNCQSGYDYLKEVGGAPEFLGLNNLVFYSTLLNDPSKTEVVLGHARRLKSAGVEHKATNLIMTACGALLRLSPDYEERLEARRTLEGLSLDTLSEKERDELDFYLTEQGSRTPKRASPAQDTGG